MEDDPQILARPVFLSKADRQLMSDATQTEHQQTLKNENMSTLELKLSQQKKNATSSMVEDAVQRDIENKEKDAVNEHESDGALEMLD